MTTMNEEALDIVEELFAWADIIDKSKGKAQVVMLTGEVFVDAAGEIIIQRGDNEALREELQQAKLDHITTLGELQEAAAENEWLRARLDDERVAVRRLGVKVKSLTSAGDALADAVVVWYDVALPTLTDSADKRVRDAHVGWQRAAMEADRG